MFPTLCGYSLSSFNRGSELASGSYSTIYLCIAEQVQEHEKHVPENQVVVLKRINGPLRCLVSECYVAANFIHDNLVPVYSVNMCPRDSGFRTEIYMKSCPEWLPTDLSMTDKIHLCHQLLNVLVFLEKNGIYHWDVKYKNLVFEKKDGRYHLYLIDFGLIGFDLADVKNVYRRPTVVPTHIYDEDDNSWHQKYRPYQLYSYSIGITLAQLLNETPRLFSICAMDEIVKNIDSIETRVPDVELARLIRDLVKMTVTDLPQRVSEILLPIDGKVNSELRSHRSAYQKQANNYPKGSIFEKLVGDKEQFYQLCSYFNQHRLSEVGFRDWRDYCEHGYVFNGDKKECLIEFPVAAIIRQSIDSLIYNDFVIKSKLMKNNMAHMTLSTWLILLNFDVSFFNYFRKHEVV